MMRPRRAEASDVSNPAHYVSSRIDQLLGRRAGLRERGNAARAAVAAGTGTPRVWRQLRGRLRHRRQPRSFARALEAGAAADALLVANRRAEPELRRVCRRPGG